MSTASVMVTTIDTAISDIVTKKVANVTVDGVDYSMLNLNDLRELRKYYAEIAAGESSAAATRAPFGVSTLYKGSGK